MSVRGKIDAFANGVTIWLRRRAFNPRRREQTWRLVGDLVAADIPLNKALLTAAQAFQGQGQKSVAAILRDIEASVARREVAARVARYVAGPEPLLFQAIGKSDATGIFRAATRLAAQQYKIRAAITSALAMPIALITIMTVIVFIMGAQLFPALDSLGSRTEMSFIARIVSAGSQWFANNALWVFAPLAALIVLVTFSVPRWSRFGRHWIDRFPPFALYKLSQGTGFVFTVIELARMGQTIRPAMLQELAAHASPYTRVRIEAIEAHLESLRWGDALAKTGYQFPSLDLITVTQALDGTPNWIDRFAGFLDRWLEQLEDRVKAQMRFVNTILMASIAVLLAGIGSSMLSIFSLAL